jgi:hypothetical protein
VISKILFTFLCFISFAYGDYSAYSYLGDRAMAQITLSDGSKWNSIVSIDHEYLLLSLEEELTPQKEVFVRGFTHTDQYEILPKNYKTHSRFVASMSKETKKQLPPITAIENEVIHLSDDTSWDLSNSQLNNYTLSEGWSRNPSMAKKGFEQYVKTWKVGDRLLVSKCPFEEDSYFLINVNGRSNISFGDARTIFYLPLSQNYD